MFGKVDIFPCLGLGIIYVLIVTSEIKVLKMFYNRKIFLLTINPYHSPLVFHIDAQENSALIRTFWAHFGQHSFKHEYFSIVL